MLQNNYHRYLNLPFEIRKPQICNVKPKDLKHYDIPNHKDDNITEFVKQFGLQIVNTELFYTPGGKKLPIHIDDWVKDDHVKINISWGPKEGTTRWWDAPNFTEEEEYDSNYNSLKDLDHVKYENFSDRHHRSIILKEEECELIYEANTDKPSLVNVGTFHSSHNPTEEGRWTLCFILGYNKDDWDNLVPWDKAIDIFKEFIDGENF
tara:strand:+ start:2232 stop:2852 length:621 start_codon:yes stop_codon:yes gene_type:complete